MASSRASHTINKHQHVSKCSDFTFYIDKLKKIEGGFTASLRLRQPAPSTEGTH